MPVFILHAWRQTRRMALRLAAIAVILGIAVGVYVGINSAIDSLYATRDHYAAALHAADAEVLVVPDDAENLPRFDDIRGVARWEARMVVPGQLLLPGGARFYTAVIAQRPGARIDRPELLAGRPLDAAVPAGVLLEHNFAAYHHLHVGSRLDVKIGNADYSLTVRGIALSPEYLTAPASPNVFLPVKGSAGVIFAPIQLLSERLGFTAVDSLVFQLQPSARAAPEVLSAIEKRARSALNVEQLLPLARQPSYMFLSADLGAFSTFVPAIIVIFAVLSMTVGFFLIYRWVLLRRQTLGVFLSLGYRPLTLMAMEAVPLLFVAAVAVLVAAPVTALTLEFFARTYSASVGMPHPLIAVNWITAAYGALGLAAAVTVLALWPMVSALRLQPLAAIRGGHASGDRGPGWLAVMTRRLRHYPQIAMPLHGVLRNPWVSGMTVAGIGLAVGVSIAYFIAIDSFNSTLARSFAADAWNMAVDFSVPVWRRDLGWTQRLPGVRRTELVVQGPVTLQSARAAQPARVTGYAVGGMRHPTMLTGAFPRYGDGIVLQSKLAARLGVAAGDTLRLISEDRHFDVRVAGTFASPVPGLAYAPITAVGKWLAMPDQATGLLIDAARPTPALADAIKGQPRVGEVIRKPQLLGRVREIADEAMSVVYLAAAFTLTAVVIILMAIGVFTVGDRAATYTTLRTLGYRDGALRRFIMVEFCMLAGLGVLLALPAGWLIADYLLGKVGAAWFDVPVRPAWRDVLWPVAPLILLVPLAVLPPVNAVLRGSLVEALRERRYG